MVFKPSLFWCTKLYCRCCKYKQKCNESWKQVYSELKTNQYAYGVLQFLRIIWNMFIVLLKTETDGETGIFKKCFWKGQQISCAAIFRKVNITKRMKLETSHSRVLYIYVPTPLFTCYIFLCINKFLHYYINNVLSIILKCDFHFIIF